MKNNNDNIITALELDNGVLYVKDSKTEDFVEVLIEKGILWEFLSSLLMDYVQGDKHTALMQNLTDTEELTIGIKHLKEVAETNKNLENQVNLLGNQLNDILNKMALLSSNIQPGSVITQSPIQGATSIPTEPVVVKKKKVKASPPKTKAGGFAALAQKATAFERK